MKKFIRVIAFFIVFIFIFVAVQNVLHYRWCDNEDIYTRNIAYKNELPDSIDVMFFGTSEMYDCIFPTEMYHQNGITGINFATQNKSAMTAYYQLKYALKYQKPKVVCCDFLAMFDPVYMPSEAETVYRKIADTMPDLDIKYGLVRDICKLDRTESALSYYFPIFRYHTMWSELEKDNFKKDYEYNKEYNTFSKGCRLTGEEYEDSTGEFAMGDTILPEFWDKSADVSVMQDFALDYFGKFIDLCHQNGAEVVWVLPPKISDAFLWQASVPEIEKYCDEKGIAFIDYSSREAVFDLGVNFIEDYYNTSHMNYKGALKVSKDLSNKLKEMYDLPDRRLDSRVSSVWDKDYDDFCKEYLYIASDIKRECDEIDGETRVVTITLKDNYPYVSVVKNYAGTEFMEIIQDMEPAKEIKVRVPKDERGTIGVLVYGNPNKAVTIDAKTFEY